MRLKRGELNGRRAALVMVSPAMLVILGLSVYPLLYTIWISLNSQNLLNPSSGEFIGFSQYAQTLSDSNFWHSIAVTAYFSVVSIAIQMVLGILIALLLNKQFFGRGFVRAIVLIPWAVPTVVNSSLWGWIFNVNYGALNRLLMQMHIIQEPVVWMATALSAMNSIILADTWRMLPLYVIMLLAGLQTVSGSMLEAGVIDGANAFKRLFHIVLPVIKPLTLVILVMRTTQTIKVFDIIYMLTKGGPSNGTMVISFYSYYQTFYYLNFGYGATVSVLVALITLLLAALYLRTLRSDDLY